MVFSSYLENTVLLFSSWEAISITLRLSHPLCAVNGCPLPPCVVYDCPQGLVSGNLMVTPCYRIRPIVRLVFLRFVTHGCHQFRDILGCHFSWVLFVLVFPPTSLVLIFFLLLLPLLSFFFPSSLSDGVNPRASACYANTLQLNYVPGQLP